MGASIFNQNKQDEQTGSSPTPTGVRYDAETNGSQPANTQIVLGKYDIHTSKEDILGKGSFSTCFKGTTRDSRKAVAIKVYKARRNACGVTLDKYKRQIDVLKEFLEDFDKNKVDDVQRYWHERFDNGKVKPTDVFMQLIDYSKDSSGGPGPDPRDNQLYVVTEMAQCSMKDFFARRRDLKKGLSDSSIKSMADAIILAMAGLAAKGLVHMDCKPENIMMFNGKLKIIDVDGCVKAGTTVAITDPSISFSPIYCAPEWAEAWCDTSTRSIVVDRDLDAWSTGMTICELVTLGAVLRPKYIECVDRGQKHDRLFMDWLRKLKRPPTPIIVNAKKDFADLCNKLLNPMAKQRMSCAEALNHSYLEKQDLSTKSADLYRRLSQAGGIISRYMCLEDNPDPYMQQGSLYKLNTVGDKMNMAHWLHQAFWLTHSGYACCYSKTPDKSLVLIDSSSQDGCTVENKKVGGWRVSGLAVCLSGRDFRRMPCHANTTKRTTHALPQVQSWLTTGLT